MRIAAISLVLAGGLLVGCGGAPARNGSGTGGAEEETGGSPGSEGGKGGSATGGKTGTGGSTGGSGPSEGTGGTTTPTSMPDASAGGSTGSPDAAPTENPVPPGAFPLCPKCKQIFDGKTLDGWEQSPAGSFVVKEDAIASTGKGAHAWTKEDYGDFRLFFQVKQNLGRPQALHHAVQHPARRRQGPGPRVERHPVPAAAGRIRGTTAPARTAGPTPTGPTPCPAPRWIRRSGTAARSWPALRPASGRPPAARFEGKESCKAVEVVRYKDPTAGKKGPFALMMHNGGLFDLYKDFWIENDPVGDELVSTK